MLSRTPEPSGALLDRLDGPRLESGRVEEVAYRVRPQRQTPITTAGETRYLVQSAWQVEGDGQVRHRWDLPLTDGEVGVPLLDPAVLPAVVKGAGR